MSSIKKPLVSICCVTFNHEKYITETINSFLMQTTTFPFQIVIGEDCSTDATLRILQEYQMAYPDIIQVKTYEKNLGAAENFKKIYESIGSKYIAFCEGDDYWTDPLKLQKQIDFLEMNSDFTICCHKCQHYDQDTQTALKCFPEITQEKELTIHDLFNANIANTCTFVYRNMNIKIPDFFDQLKLGDWPLHMLHAEFGKIKYFPDIMAVYRVHGKGTWTSGNQLHHLESSITMLKSMKNYLNNSYNSEINYSIANHLLAQAMSYQSAHDFFKADQCFKEASIYINKKSYLRIKYLIKKALFHIALILSKRTFNV